MKNLTEKSYHIGEFLLELVQLQMYWLLFSLKGGIILGVFPATATVVQYFLYKFEEKPLEEASLYQWFNIQFKQSFKVTNQLGWISTVVLLVLRIDLQVSRYFIQNKGVHFLLLFLLVLVLGTNLYLFPSYLRYQLTFFQYFKQAFFLFLSTIPETIAMIVGIFLLTMVNVLLPILTVVALVPLFVLPITWFAYRGMLKIESNHNS